jgi:hypothetical protein
MLTSWHYDFKRIPIMERSSHLLEEDPLPATDDLLKLRVGQVQLFFNGEGQACHAPHRLSLRKGFVEVLAQLGHRSVVRNWEEYKGVV